MGTKLFGDAYQALFDGRTLEGWRLMESPNNPKFVSREENFVVKDGAIHCLQSPDRKGAMLLSEKEYGDFELTLDLWTDWGCDSGIILRADEGCSGIQILNDYLEDGIVGFPFGEGTGGFISRPFRLHGLPDKKAPSQIVARDVYDAVEIDGLVESIGAEDFNALWKRDDWNALTIRCVGPEPIIVTWINGVKVMEMDGRSYRARGLKDEIAGDRDAPSAWNQSAIQAQLGSKGLIAFQVHPGGRWAKDGATRYRNIKIRELNR